MAFILHIDNTSNPRVKAFLAFVKTLDFVSIEKKQAEKSKTLTSEEKNAIDIGLKQIEEGKVIPHKQAMAELKNRHPRYFK